MHSKMKVKSSTNSSAISFSLFFERWSDWSSNLQPSGGNSSAPMSISCNSLQNKQAEWITFSAVNKRANSLPNPNIIYFLPVLALFQYSVATYAEVFLNAGILKLETSGFTKHLQQSSKLKENTKGRKLSRCKQRTLEAKAKTK